ncbi:DUF2264 domain-containing protein, partial [Phytoactinopolyspora endophytica]|uniref:DUF2264 domain-containing protein n=1 Tax=Phytoactinopolyspora endophytica TaxID=1642495 RepID=UPI00197C24FF
TSPSSGLLRRAASGVVAHFADNGSPDDRGLLTMGWHHEWRSLAQSYSGPSSPYWAAKGMLGLALPADHPVWTAAEEPLQVEQDDDVWVAQAPGWLVSSTRNDGVVRVANHGTDHAVVGASAADSPLYARLGYSTATSPLLSPDAWHNPVDQSVSLLDADGRGTHRAGMRTLRTDVVNAPDGTRAAVGVSVARARWVEPASGQRDHGSGRGGSSRDAAAVTTVSILRGPWEVRCVRVDPLADAPDAVSAAERLRVGGWPLAADVAPKESATVDGAAEVRSTRAMSTVFPGDGFDEAGIHRADDASPLGDRSATPWVSGPVRPGRWSAVVVGLNGVADAQAVNLPPTFDVDGQHALVRVEWPDGRRTEVDLPRSAAENVPQPQAG